MAAADTPNVPEGAEEVAPGRRVVLRGISALGLAAFAAPLAACGGDDDDPTAAEATPEATPEPTAEATPSAKPTKSAKPSKSPKAEPTATTDATKSAKPEATPKPEKTPKAEEKLVKDGNTPLAATSDIEVNSGALFEFEEYVVTQPKSGQFIGFDSLCTHEACPVDVFDTPGEMACSCHSTIFDLTTGAVKSGPARRPLPKKPIIVEGGQIYKAKKA